MKNKITRISGQPNANSPDVSWPDRAVWLLAGAYLLFFTLFSYFLYQNLLYEDFDLAVHAQTMWNLVHGTGFSSILGVHFLANHFIPAFYPLSLVYRFYPDPLLLLFLQSLALASGVILTYKIARRMLDKRWSLVMALAYFFYPAIGFANLFEFHPTTLAVPFIFLMILAYGEQKFSRFILFAAIAMTFQENIPLAVGMMGVVGFLERRNARWIFAPMVFAGVWFYIAVGKIQPFFNRGTIEFLILYSRWGKNIPEILTNLLLQPWALVRVLFSVPTLMFFAQLLGPLLFLPLLAWRTLVPIFPFLLQHLLSVRPQEQQITYHYAAEMTPFFILAAIGGLRRILDLETNKIIRGFVAFAFICALILTGILVSPYFRSLDRWERFAKSQELEFKKKLLSVIPPEAPTVATFQFLPLLSSRAEIYSFHHVMMGTYTLSYRPYVLPESTQYALLDMKDPLMLGFGRHKGPENIRKFLNEWPWEVIDFAQDTILLKKGRRDLSDLYEVNPEKLKSVPEHFVWLKAYLESNIKLMGFAMRVGRARHADHVGITLYWKALKKAIPNYTLVIDLVDGRGRTVEEVTHNICYRLHPTNEWKAGEEIVENIWFIMPPKLPRESLEMRMGLVDIDHDRLGVFRSPLKDKTDNVGRVRIETFDPQ